MCYEYSSDESFIGLIFSLSKERFGPLLRLQNLKYMNGMQCLEQGTPLAKFVAYEAQAKFKFDHRI